MKNVNIKLLDSNDGCSLALSINGYSVFETCGADVLAFAAARICTKSFHAPANEPDLFREKLTDGIRVWMADTDRGHATAWSFDGGNLAHYVATLAAGGAS